MKKLLFALWAVTLVSIFNFASDKTSADYESCVGNGTGCVTTTNVSIHLSWGNLCIWSPSSFTFDSVTVSSSDQVAEKQFTGTFGNDDWWWYVDDQRGADSGYYTTIQLSGDLTNGWWGVISGSNLSIKSKRTTTTDVWLNPASGSVNTRVLLSGAMVSPSYAALDLPVGFIYRNTAANSWLLGKYYDYPWLKLTIPAYTPVGTYSATIVYTLYELGH